MLTVEEVLENLFASYVVDLVLIPFEEVITVIPDKVVRDGLALVHPSFPYRIPFASHCFVDIFRASQVLNRGLAVCRKGLDSGVHKWWCGLVTNGSEGHLHVGACFSKLGRFLPRGTLEGVVQRLMQFVKALGVRGQGPTEAYMVVDGVPVNTLPQDDVVRIIRSQAGADRSSCFMIESLVFCKFTRTDLVPGLTSNPVCPLMASGRLSAERAG